VCHDHHLVLHPTPELFNSDAEAVVSQGEVSGRTPFAATLGRMPAGGQAEATWRAVLRPHIEPGDERYGHTVEVTAAGLAAPLTLDATVQPGPVLPGALVRRATSGPLAATLEIEPLSGTPIQGGDALKLKLVLAAAAAVDEVAIADRPGPAVDPLAGSACLGCHTRGDRCDAETIRMYKALSSLDRELRAAGETLHRAEIAGMEVSEPQFELKSKGRTATIESRALIHGFDPDRLIARTDEGKTIAGAALAAGERALAEIKTRRTGLLVSLVLVGLVLLALWLKIRDVERGRRARAA
jgi:hypothetical protein